ncbi:cyn operon transcriptional activator [Klebsiella aerogenes]|nr:cyn operon transcriptional activator [Klebsiella aerogenes]
MPVARLRELEEGRRALHDAEDLQHGKLRIAMTPTFTTYMLGPLMEAYYRRYPGVKVLIQEMNQERMEAMLLEDELDVGLPLTTAGHRKLWFSRY